MRKIVFFQAMSDPSTAANPKQFPSSVVDRIVKLDADSKARSNRVALIVDAILPDLPQNITPDDAAVAVKFYIHFKKGKDKSGANKSDMRTAFDAAGILTNEKTKPKMAKGFISLANL